MNDPVRLINTFDQLKAARAHQLPDVAIMPRHWQCGRSTYRDGWKVWRPGCNIGLEKDEWDGDYGCKVFKERDQLGDNWRAEAFASAVEWAGRRYKISHFVRNRMGDYVDSRVNEMFPLPKREKRKTA